MYVYIVHYFIAFVKHSLQLNYDYTLCIEKQNTALQKRRYFSYLLTVNGNSPEKKNLAEAREVKNHDVKFHQF